ncbi:3'-5' exonuclease [Cellulomonas sp. P4]|uniref:3'-5' exonuclease n=1 Tax=Cellulomonas sp. P4 TaxID=3142533 RepID=UPI0031BA1E7E
MATSGATRRTPEQVVWDGQQHRPTPAAPRLPRPNDVSSPSDEPRSWPTPFTPRPVRLGADPLTLCYPSAHGDRYDGPFAIIDVETTGMSPRRGDRVVEVAIVRVDHAGRVLDEYSTLVNPDGRDTGPVHIHRIRASDVIHAPKFGDLAEEVLSRLDGAVVVAHNAAFEERFLRAEFQRAGVPVGALPALCSLRLARQVLTLPNYRLETIARAAGLPLVDTHTALGDVRLVAALLPGMLRAAGAPLSWQSRLTAPGQLCAPRLAVPREVRGTELPTVTEFPERMITAYTRVVEPKVREARGAGSTPRPGGAVRVRRCSACGEPGHYRPTCPNR